MRKSLEDIKHMIKPIKYFDDIPEELKPYNYYTVDGGHCIMIYLIFLLTTLQYKYKINVG
jgi:hypothetical protein